MFPLLINSRKVLFYTGRFQFRADENTRDEENRVDDAGQLVELVIMDGARTVQQQILPPVSKDLAKRHTQYHRLQSPFMLRLHWHIFTTHFLS